jgi:hypothetical protein
MKKKKNTLTELSRKKENGYSSRWLLRLRIQDEEGEEEEELVYNSDLEHERFA